MSFAQPRPDPLYGGLVGKWSLHEAAVPRYDFSERITGDRGQGIRGCGDYRVWVRGLADTEALAQPGVFELGRADATYAARERYGSTMRELGLDKPWKGLSCNTFLDVTGGIDEDRFHAW